MPNIKLAVGAKAADAKAKKIGYTGPRPPKGVYRVKVKRITCTVNKNGDYMLNCVAEINEPKGSSKAKFNGYGIWWNGNLTEDGAGYINQFIDSITGGKREVRTALWNGKLRTFDAPKKGHKAQVMAIGPFKINQEGIAAVVNTRLGKPYNGEQNLQVADWLLPSQVSNEQAEAAEGSDEDDDDIVDDDDVATDVNEDEADEDEADESDESEDSDEDEDGDDSLEYTEEDENEPPF